MVAFPEGIASILKLLNLKLARSRLCIGYYSVLGVVNLGVQLHHIGRHCAHLYPMIVRIVVLADDDRYA